MEDVDRPRHNFGMVLVRVGEERRGGARTRRNTCMMHDVGGCQWSSRRLLKEEIGPGIGLTLG
jgi:hypothetical protein